MPGHQLRLDSRDAFVIASLAQLCEAIPQPTVNLIVQGIAFPKEGSGKAVPANDRFKQQL